MKRIYFRTLLILTTAVLSISCDWLNVTPSNAVDEDDLFKTGYGCRNSLNGVYLKLGSADLYGRNLSWGLLSSVAQEYLTDDSAQGSNAAQVCRDGADFVYNSSTTKPLIASVLSVGLCGVCYRLLARVAGESALLTLGALVGCLLLYPVFGCLCGGIGREDVMLLPCGEKLCRVLTLCRLLPRQEGEKKEEKEGHERTGKGAVGERTV